MKQIFILLLVAGSSLFLGAQTKFEKGYFIGNDGNRVECLIRNVSWRYNPSDFTYQVNDTAQPKTLSTGDVLEFGLDGGNRFISREVMADLSSDDESNLDNKKDPAWMKVHYFLSILVEGKANLYKYVSPAMTRFFYSKEDLPLQQLVYKKYRPYDDKDFIGTNLFFRQQLWNNANNGKLTVKQLEQVNYEERDLVTFFTAYNLENGGNNKLITKKRDKVGFHLDIDPGVSFSNVTVQATSTGFIDENSPDWVFDTKAGFRIGINFEIVIPYTNRKVIWMFEPNYKYYYGNCAGTNIPIPMVANINLIEIPTGVRYYAFLNKNLSVFGNVLVTLPFMTFAPGSDVNFKDYPEAGYHPRGGLSVGGGVMWKRFGAECRYNLRRKSVSHYEGNLSSYDLLSKYKSLELMVSFRLF
ncbi:MAG: hypothetical protein ACM3N9_00820 [Syntrophothermus sp.]